jgi:hypothetical protein
MNVEDIILHARTKLDDNDVHDPAWADWELIAYANEAEKEACRRAHLLIDSSTAAITSISVTAGTDTYALHPNVLLIFTVRGTWESQTLTEETEDHLNDVWYAWDQQSGTPQFYVKKLRSIQLVPNPNENGTLTLEVSRLPENVMIEGSEPEIPEQYHMGLVNWICALALQKEDVDTENRIRSSDCESAFEREFGKRPTAYNETMRRILPRRAKITPREFGF